MKITSATAYSIQLYYDQFYLKPGAEFFIYNETLSMIIGAFTSANNKISGLFATQPVMSESIILELFEPFSMSGRASIIHINQVGHAYMNLFGLTPELTDADDCLIDVNCPEGSGWANQIRSVVQILKKDLLNNLKYASGVMINNTNSDGKPYLLTAFHVCDIDVDCLIGISDEDMLEQWIFRFNYQLPACSTGTAPTDQTVTGAELRAHEITTDMALLELSEMAKQNYNVFLAGWNSSPTEVYNSGVGIHHSGALPKKIAVCNNPLVTGNKANNGTCPINDNVYWHVKYVDGFNTENGIVYLGGSGSPFFNAMGQIVGQLSGVDLLNCAIIPASNPISYYGKFSESWIASDDLSNFLSPGTSSVTALSGINLNDISSVNTCGNDIQDGDETGINCGGTFCPPCIPGPDGGSSSTCFGVPGGCDALDYYFTINGYANDDDSPTGTVNVQDAPCIELPIVLRPAGNCSNPKWKMNYTYTENEWCNDVNDPALCNASLFDTQCDCKYLKYQINIQEYDGSNWINHMVWYSIQRNIANEADCEYVSEVMINQNDISLMDISLVSGKTYWVTLRFNYEYYATQFQISPSDISYTNTNLVHNKFTLNNLITASTLVENPIARNITLDNVTTINFSIASDGTYAPDYNNIDISATNNITITNSVITSNFVARIIDDPACSQGRLADQNSDEEKTKPPKNNNDRIVYYNANSIKNEKKQSSISSITGNETSELISNTEVAFLVIPNPSSNGKYTFSSQILESGNYEITIYNLLGEVVFKTRIPNPINTIDISTQPKGIYFVQIQNGEEISVQKIVYQ